MPDRLNLSDLLMDAYNAGVERVPFDYRDKATDWLVLYEENRPLQVPDEGQTLDVQGIVNMRGLPLVQIRFTPDGVSGGQFTPDEARAHAALVVEAAANASYEASLWLWLTQEMKLDKDKAAQAIGAMRIWRADKWGAPDIPKDWRSG